MYVIIMLITSINIKEKKREKTKRETIGKKFCEYKDKDQRSFVVYKKKKKKKSNNKNK